MVEEIDQWIEEGKYKNRSDAIKSILNMHWEREKTREFLLILNSRSEEAKKSPNDLIPLEE